MSRAFHPVKPCDPDLPKSAVRRLFDQVGGVKLAALRLSLGLSQTYAFADPQVHEEITFARVAALTSPAAPAAAEYLAGLAGGVNGVGDIAGHPALEKAYQAGKSV